MSNSSSSYPEFSDRCKWYLLLFLGLHVLLWTLGPSLFRPSLTHDTIEGLAWGAQWQLGYNKHPFLAAWLSAGFSHVFNNTGWPVYLLAQLAVLATFLAVWCLLKRMMAPVYALIATLALEGVLFYNLNSFNFTPDTLQSPLWAWLVYFFYAAISQKRYRDWLGVGLLAGLCILAKYQSALLILTLFLYLLSQHSTRQHWRKPGIYLAIFIGLIIT